MTTEGKICPHCHTQENEKVQDKGCKEDKGREEIQEDTRHV